ncbi:MAG: DUF4286 family protein [Tannerellaceae bacterium]|jgi:hypothetical protein|nr:DUF4286 family protein [Tannerellaceae bacterium]
MIIYNITFHVENEALTKYLRYLKTTYIPKATKSALLYEPCLRKILHDVPAEGTNLAVQFRAKDVDTLNYWLEKEGRFLHEDIAERFGSKVAGFSTLMEEMDLNCEE